ncbi:MAG TPA: copper resistance protein NlpE [Parafilimonas sp.]|nr:copper resistance protein NlpE [Parafilimonas sp.]
MKFIYIIFLIILIASCNSNKNGIASTDSSYKTVVPQTPVINAENYVGTLPCADCEGIDVSLQLNRDSTFIMNSVYTGSRVDSLNNHFNEMGSWRLHEPDTLYLTDANRHFTKYIKTDTALIQLDGDGNRIAGPLASMFVLHKK